MWRIFLIISIFFSTPIDHLFSQELRVEVPRRSISLDEFFTLNLTISPAPLSRPSYTNFPELKGLVKVGVPTTSTTLEGEASSLSITQRYKALAEGSYSQVAASMKFGDKVLLIPAFQLGVGPKKNSNQASEIEVYEELLRLENRREFVEVKDDAFLDLSISKKEVFVGEGVTVALSLFVAENNRADLEIYQQAQQLSRLIAKLKPVNCWEEDYGIREFQAISMVINRKKYNVYPFYKATFYPFNNKSLVFPMLKLKMLKYKVDRETGERQSAYKVFSSRAARVKVKDLPSHPLREQVPVGDFRLDEQISFGQVQTGQGVKYNFRIHGEGNLRALTLTPLRSDSLFDLYPPTVRQTIYYTATQITGSKLFSFQLVAKKAGEYPLQHYFFLPYFNSRLCHCDTLHSQIRLKVKGEDLKNLNLISQETEPVYATPKPILFVTTKLYAGWEMSFWAFFPCSCWLPLWPAGVRFSHLDLLFLQFAKPALP
jgi:hypothetical protein